MLSACSTLGFGDEEMADENDMAPENATETMAQDNMEPMPDEVLSPEEELMMQKDDALMAQAMRLAQAEQR
ncbi:hypothetical protein N8742_04210 [Emcibacteraceae bacterium]|nr:hypothetical protein [Emcibacteraceae bacterium]MDA9553477.1 hypothetical protein [Emcibacteraceae bacterium]